MMNSYKNLSQVIRVFDMSPQLKEEAIKKIDQELFGSTRKMKVLASRLRSGENTSVPLTSAMKKMAGRMENKLLDRAFLQKLLTDLPNAYDHTWYRCYRNVILCQVLCMNGLSSTARPIMMKTLRTARRHHFTSIAVEMCRMLHYDSALSGKSRSFFEYRLLSNVLEEIYNAEIKTEKHECRMVMYLNHRQGYTSDIRKKITGWFKETKAMMKKYKSHQLKVNYFRIGIRYFEMNGQPQHVIKLCSQFHNYLMKHPHLVRKVNVIETAIHAIDSCLDLRDLVRGKRLAHDCERHIPNINYNWYVFNEIYFRLCLHGKNFLLAQTVYDRVTGSEGFKTLPPERVEKWKLFKVFLDLALDRDYQHEQLNPVKFINDLPKYGTDKHGLNFAIMTAEFICLLMGNHQDKLIDYEERFKQYVKRYVSRKSHYRAWYFSKLILLLFKYRYDAAQSQKIGAKFHQRLCNFKKKKIRDYEMIEIIPYEHLWEMLLKQVQVKAEEYAQTA